MKCCSLVLHCGQANDRTSCPHMLGSIEVNLMGELQAVHIGPWFCLSSIRYPYVGRQHDTVSVTDRCRYRAVMELSMLSPTFGRCWSILPILRNYLTA